MKVMVVTLRTGWPSLSVIGLMADLGMFAQAAAPGLTIFPPGPDTGSESDRTSQDETEPSFSTTKRYETSMIGGSVRAVSGICHRTELDQVPAMAWPAESLAGVKRARARMSSQVAVSRCAFPLLS